MHITILGAGGGGSLIALQLANLGIRNLRIVDNDIITESNLNRQFLFDNSDINRYKVDVLKEFLLNRNPAINIVTNKKRLLKVNDVRQEIRNSDWCFCCMDEPPYIAQRIVNRACFLENIPSAYGFSARDSAKFLIVYPKITGCIDCLLTSRDNYEFQQLVTSFINGDFHLSTPIIIPNMMLETSWMVKKWLDAFIGNSKIESILYRFDYNLLREDPFIKFERQKDCPTCGHKENCSELWKLIPIK